MFDPSTHVLVVDDMLTMRKLVKKALKELKFTSFTEAEDGQKAWDALGAANPPIGLIVSDWNMPNCTGIDFLKRVRADARFKALPFLMVTAEAEKTQVAEAIKAGVSNYIVKPFTPQTLGVKIEQIYKKING